MIKFMSFKFWIALCLCSICFKACNRNVMHWPTYIMVEDNSRIFEDDIFKAIDEFNFRFNHNILDIEDSSLRSVIVIEIVDTLPKNYAGTSLLYYNTCSIQIEEQFVYSISLFYPLLWHEIGHCAKLRHIPTEGEIMYYQLMPLSSLNNGASERFFDSLKKAINWVDMD